MCDEPIDPKPTDPAPDPAPAPAPDVPATPQTGGGDPPPKPPK